MENPDITLKIPTPCNQIIDPHVAEDVQNQGIDRALLEKTIGQLSIKEEEEILTDAESKAIGVQSLVPTHM